MVKSMHVRTFTSLPGGDFIPVTPGQGSDERSGQIRVVPNVTSAR
jgi:hypothetical protein